ncbi:MAG: glycosyltransferase family 2 protein [Candidatus Competibacteraceae bacterium]
MAMEIGFWLCLWLVVYIYIGYPLSAFLLGAIHRRDVRKAKVAPRVSILIAAYNEEREIEHTVINKLHQDYPLEQLEIIVVSDGSTDRTDEIVADLAAGSGGRVRLLRQEPRQGKTQALNRAAVQATGEILVFADANSLYAPDALRALVRNFADPAVGYVSGKMVYTYSEGGMIGEGSSAYMQYENLLRTLETRLGSIVGVDGGIDAVRRELYVPMRPDQLPDFVLPLNVIEQGRRVVYEADALLYEPALAEANGEYQMRVRVALRALWALYDKRRLFNLFRFPLFAWQLFSHKGLRYLAFLFLAGLLVCNSLLLGQSPFYDGFFALQLLAYSLAGLGHYFRSSPFGSSKLFTPYYFAVLNGACAVAFWKFLCGRRIVLWKPRTGAYRHGDETYVPREPLPEAPGRD